jgi:hypothetical protein
LISALRAGTRDPFIYFCFQPGDSVGANHDLLWELANLDEPVELRLRHRYPI